MRSNGQKQGKLDRHIRTDYERNGFTRAEKAWQVRWEKEAQKREEERLEREAVEMQILLATKRLLGVRES